MFERYTEKARRVIFFARYEASQFGASQIEPEHILLAILREDRHLAARFFPIDSPNYQRIRKSIETHEASKRIRADDLPLSSAGKNVLGFAAREANLLGNRYIGPEHLLLGLLSEEGTKAYEILTEIGLRLDYVRKSLKDEDPAKISSIIDRSINLRTDQPEEECWSREVLKTCLDLGLITISELASEFASVSALRNFTPDIEALLRLLVARGLADQQNPVVLAMELRDEEKLVGFIEKLKEKGAQS
jgi:ATP-dependent Clp protease ATP-binding subunit ClpC